MSKVFKPRTLTLLRCNQKMNRWESESTVPTVTLAGRWMYEAGFRSGQKIQIIVQERELIIRIESDPRQTDGKQPVIEWERKRTCWSQPPRLTSELDGLRWVQRIRRKMRKKESVVE